MILRKQQTGFTIVELLIVIVVIAILAAISIVAYNGIQKRARDTTRKSDLASIAKAVQLYGVDNGTIASNGCGNGWLPTDPDGAGPNKSFNACLIDGKYITSALVDPSGLGSCSGLSCHAYMHYSCSQGTFLYANLETAPQTSTDTDATCASTYDTGYGMNYVVKVN